MQGSVVQKLDKIAWKSRYTISTNILLQFLVHWLAKENVDLKIY